jgi:hypothetical protein
VQFLHQLQEQDQEILALRAALKEERQQHPTSGQFNTMVPLHEAEMGEPEPFDDENDLDFELLATLMAETDRPTPLQRQPYNAAPYPTANKSVATAATNEARATHSSSYMVHEAAPPQVRSQPPTPAQAPNQVVAPVDTKGLYTCQPAPNQPKSLPKGITCSIMAAVNGKEVDCVLDTGTATSTITLDCLRKLGLDSLVDPSAFSYLNADGCATIGKGKVHNIVLSLGDFVTRISPTVTAALHYNMLIGNDVLHRARAVIDYNRGKMVIQVHPTLSQEMEIFLTTPKDSGCYNSEVVGSQVTPPALPRPPDEAYLVSDAPPQPSCTCAAGKPNMNKGLQDSEALAGMWAPSPYESAGTGHGDSSTPSTQAAFTAARAAQQTTLQTPTTTPMEPTVPTTLVAHSNYSLVAGTPPATNVPETQHPAADIKQAALMLSLTGSRINTGPKTAHTMTERHAWCLEDWATDASPGMSHLLTSGLTSVDAGLSDLGCTKPGVAACAAAMNNAGCVLSLKPNCMDFWHHLQQDNAEIHDEVLTIFDPGGCHLHAPWRAVCCSPTPVI